MIGFKILVTAGLLLIGGLLVLNQQMNIGQFVAAEIIILLVISSVEKLIKGLETFYDVLTSLEKIGQFVDKDLEPQEGIDPFATEQTLKVELEKVNYLTPEGFSILNNVNLSISQNDRILLDGASGSGKSTLLKLLSGISFPSSGTLYVNDNSIKGIWPNRYRSQVGQVLPEQQTFEGSILENITFNDPSISRDRLNEVLKNLSLLPFIKAQPNGLNTMLYPQGQQIPHSVAKRIVLARAIINSPKLLLLKDPLEHLNYDETKSIIEYLTHESQPWAIVVSSNNPLWKSRCSRTIKLIEGTLNAERNA
jgi:ABC-type bacteriocin/lantibiotic exporter with double-glycine peptidase domain